MGIITKDPKLVQVQGWIFASFFLSTTPLSLSLSLCVYVRTRAPTRACIPVGQPVRVMAHALMEVTVLSLHHVSTVMELRLPGLVTLSPRSSFPSFVYAPAVSLVSSPPTLHVGIAELLS